MRELAEGVPALAPKIDPPHRWHGGGYPLPIAIFGRPVLRYLTQSLSSSYLCPVLLGFCDVSPLSEGGSGEVANRSRHASPLRQVASACLAARYLRAS